MAKQVWKPATLLSPLPAALVTCGTVEEPNVLTIAWTGIINSSPAMTYISVRPERWSHHLIAESGEFVIEDGVEDVHSQVELMLTRKLGDVGKKIHSGRSRNDQVLVDLKLFMRDELLDIARHTKQLFDRLIALSEEHKAKCQAKLDVLNEQYKDMTTSIGQLLDDIAAGRKYMKVYRQMKMYNDPALNPVLYGSKK